MSKGVTSVSVHSGNRFMELEGLRGIAAIIVVIFHAILMFYPGIFYGPGSYVGELAQRTHPGDSFYGNPVMGILTGSLSVAIFFVLSGFVLSVKFFSQRDGDVIQRLASKRYVRLMVPVLAATLFAYIIIQSGMGSWRSQMAEITHSSWLSGLWLQAPNFWEAFCQGIYGAFVSSSVSYDPVLWTVKYELIGSFIVFSAALLFFNSKHRWIVYLILSFIFASSWYLGFILGMMLADIYVNKRKVLKAIPSWALVVGALIGVGLGAFPPTSLKGTVFQWIQIPWLSQAQNMSLYLVVAATFIILATLLLPSAKRFFSHSKVAPLGKYTFSLYLIHMPILFSVGAGVFVAMHGVLGFHKAIVVSTLSAFLCMLPVAFLFEKYIDAPSIKLSAAIADIYSGRRHIIRFSFGRLWMYLMSYRKVLRQGLEFLSNAFGFKYIKDKRTTVRELVDEDIE